MINWIKENTPWIYFHLWMLDYIWYIPAAVAILSSVAALVYNKLMSVIVPEKEDETKEELRFIDILSITSLSVTAGLVFIKSILLCLA